MYSYAAMTDIGNYYKINDDRIMVGEEIISEGSLEGKSENKILAAICDGVGGLAMGYRAANMALVCLSKLNHEGTDRSEIRKVIENANKKIRDRQEQENMKDAMMTTLAAVYLDGDSFYVFNAGDSRVYVFRKGTLRLLSKDHSLVQNLIDSGDITAEDKWNHPEKNIITKCLGYEESVNARIIDLSGEAETGDIFVLCSDGVSDCLRDEQISSFLMKNNYISLTDLCEEIINSAKENGSTDNISVCLIKKES